MANRSAVGGIGLIAFALAACSGVRTAERDAFARARSHFAKGEFGAARTEIASALRFAPDDPQVLLLAARTYVELGEGGAADIAVQRLKEVAPKTDLADLQAEVDLLQQEPQNALDALRRGNIHSGRLYGEALVMDGRTEEGRKALEQQVAAHPADAKAMVALGFIRFFAGDAGAAHQLARKALTIDPKRIAGHMLIAQIALSRNDRRTAMSAFDQILKVSPNDSRAIFGKARLLQDAGRDREAAALVDRGVQLWPNDPKGLHMKAWSLAQAGKLDEAQELVQRAGSGFDNDPVALAFAGDLALRRGNPDVAIDRYNAAIRLQPQLSHLKIKLARAQIAAHSVRDAMDTLKAFDDIKPTPIEVVELRKSLATGTSKAPRPYRAAAP